MPIPIRDVETRFRVKQLGLDPDKVDLVEIADLPPQTPAPQPIPTPIQEPSVLGKLWQTINRPNLNFDPEFIRKTSLLNLLPIPEAVKKGGSDAGAELASGLTSFLGLGTLAATPLLFPTVAAGAATPLISKIAAGTFGALGAKGLYESGKQAREDYKSGAGTEALTKDATLALASLAQMVPGIGLLAKGLRVKPTPTISKPATPEGALRLLKEGETVPIEAKQIGPAVEPKLLPESTTLPARIEPEISPKLELQTVPKEPLPLTAPEPTLPVFPRARVDINSPLPPETPSKVQPPVIENSRLPWSIAEIDRIERLGTPEAKELANAMTGFFDAKETYRGKYVNEPQNAIRNIVGLNNVPKSMVTNPLEYLKQNTPEMDNVVKYLFDIQDGIPPKPLSPKEQLVLGEVRKFYADPEVMKYVNNPNPNYLSNIPKSSVIKLLTQKPKGRLAEVKNLSDDFIDYQIKTGRAADKVAGEKLLNNYLGNLSNAEANRAAHFGPIDKNAGIGLPPSWRNTNLLEILGNYGDRVSGRFAWRDTIESNPTVQQALEPHNYGNNESVKSVLGQIAGTAPRDNPIVAGLSGVVKASVMQFLSGVRDVASAPFIGLRYHNQPVQAGINLVKSFTKIRENIADAWDTGRIRHNQSSLEINLGLDDLGKNLRRVREVLSDTSTRNWMDRMARSTLLGQGKFTTIDFHSDFVKGKLSPQGKAWFENFAKGVDWQKSSLTSEEITQISSRYVDKAQGVYDARGLPRLAYEGNYSPYLSLARWGIEQSNNFIKHSVQPAIQQGNYRPLLNDTVGLVLGGSGVLFLTSLINGKKQQTPTLKELSAEPSVGGVAYWLAGLADASGQLGMIGSVLKSVMDVTYGKNRPQEVDNILVSTVGKIGDHVTSFASAVMDEGISPKLAGQFIHNVLNDLFQNYRLIANHLDTDKTDLANKKRDLRMFETLSGKEPTDRRSEFVPSLKDLQLKEFKQTTNLNKAAELLPQLIDKAKAAAGGDIEKFVKEMDKIKSNSYNTMPNPESSPLKEKGVFTQYYNFLVKTQGKEEADRRVRDWAEHQLKNQIKTEKLKDN